MINLRLAGVRTKCSRKNKETKFPCSDNNFSFKVDGDTASTVKTVYFWIEKGEDRFIGREGGGQCFSDAQRIILIDYLQKGQTITGEYYATLLRRLHKNCQRSIRNWRTKNILFHQDNAPAHTSAVSMTKVHKLGFKLLPHLPYSPDLVPSHFFLFPNLKIWLGGKRFSSDEEVIAAVDEYLKGFETSYFSEEIKKLEERWIKCVEVEGDYVEK